MEKQKIEELTKQFIIAIGDDPNRDGLRETPRRVAEMCDELFGEITYKTTVFHEEKYSDMVIIKDISFSSFCEHHLLPFFGTVSVCYIPSDKIIGLSKIARIVDKNSHKLQMQERLTSQILEDIENSIHPQGVGVLIEAEHTCMTIRGVKAKGSKTVTVAFDGDMKDINRQNMFINMTNR